jgi:uncharacterized protein (DUF2062 family)
MPKKFIKKWMPDHEKIRRNPQLNKLFGTLLHDPNLLHLNRRSVTGAFFLGLFMAFVPIPFQMLPAAAGAIWWRVNLPISVGLVWITNPITIPPLFYFAYKVGAWTLRLPVRANDFNISWDWLTSELAAIWEPFLLGCLICALVSATLGAITIRLLWRLNVVRQWERRKRERAASKPPTQT